MQGNSFKALGTIKEGEEVTATPMVKDQQESPTKVPMEEEAQQIIGTKEDEGEDMDLGELDLEAIEEECRKKGQGYVSRHDLELL